MEVLLLPAYHYYSMPTMLQTDRHLLVIDSRTQTDRQVYKYKQTIPQSTHQPPAHLGGGGMGVWYLQLVLQGRNILPVNYKPTKTRSSYEATYAIPRKNCINNMCSRWDEKRRDTTGGTWSCLPRYMIRTLGGIPDGCFGWRNGICEIGWMSIIPGVSLLLLLLLQLHTGYQKYDLKGFFQSRVQRSNSHTQLSTGG